MMHCRRPYVAALAACLAIQSSGLLAAQTPRPQILEPLSDAYLETRLRTAADTPDLFQAVVPAALDSLRHSADSTWARLLVIQGLDSTRGSAWLVTLLTTRRVRGLCGPIRMRCHGVDAVRVSLEDEPGLGDNAVRVVLSRTAVRESARTVYFDDWTRQWAQMVALGMPMPDMCGGAFCSPGPLVMGILPTYVLEVLATPEGWRIVGWQREPRDL